MGVMTARVIRDGKVIEERTVRNLMTNAGFAERAGLLIATDSPTAFSYIAIGIGTTAANAADTTLETESMRGQGALSRVTTTQTNDTAQIVEEFAIVSTLAITESGVLNAASVGDLLNRATFTAINVVNGDTLEITWKIQMS